MRTSTSSRRGFSLVEIITALTILAIIGSAMTKMILSQTRGYQYESGGRRSRSTARAAMNIMITDLRMTQDNGGLSYVDATNHRRVDVKVPVGIGIVCTVSGSSLIMALTPVDSFQLASINFGGYAVRNSTTGIYAYVSGGAMTSADVNQCHGNGVYADTVPINGRTGAVVQVTGTPPVGSALGSMAMVWQTVRYSFDSSKAFPGRAGLYRIVTGSTTADTNELVAPFSWNARFKYYTTMSRSGGVVDDSPKTSSPADLNTVRGLQIYLAAEASDTVPGYSGPKKSPLTTAVFFKNTRIQ
jgi:prepilin-type N-terminal cleavage/methylation domain-containing protein